MGLKSIHLCLPFLFLFFHLSRPSPPPQPIHESFLHCFSLLSPASNTSQIIHSPTTPLYASLLTSTIQNLRFTTPTTPRPLLLLTPTTPLEVQASVACAKYHGLSVRARSGGHDYEGLSYRSVAPGRFVVVDVSGLRAVCVDTALRAARVQSGATLGELYYEITKKSGGALGFPGGICPTVGVGGHLSGGGIGPLMRKHGLAADNVVDAELVDANGRLLDRAAMGEALFWAIRGGGVGSFGIVLSWTLRLVPVPGTLSAFAIRRFLVQGEEEAMAQLLSRWQLIAHRLPDDMFLKASIEPKVGKDGKRRPSVVFRSLFLGNCSDLVSLVGEALPELHAERSDCTEMSWIQSVLYLFGYTNGEAMEVLLDRKLQSKDYYKVKLDYLTSSIPVSGLVGIFDMILQEDDCSIDMDPQGGRMSEIAETETPYAHRKGYLYNVQYSVKWGGDKNVTYEEKHLDWVRRVYSYMTPYVSRRPRAAYVNFRDLDLGQNVEGNTSYAGAKVWGRKYFGGNFRRLALVKGEVDPGQVFWSEQSIPPLFVAKIKNKTGLVSEDRCIALSTWSSESAFHLDTALKANSGNLQIRRKEDKLFLENAASNVLKSNFVHS